ncbi:ERCC4 domain-containing protein [Nocardioides litoris]|uniref:ERCC4 domain-containing protein n=1 Tax=Nocardioides litoris TaxID=1926648 RepID=UPI00111E4758|nr:histone-like nucleoid-structuring protein Lsr2 [Nocardioides litoris]
MPDDFVIARNPDGDSTLPYLLRVPLPGRPVVLKARDTWPRTSKIYCHRVEEWPAEPEVVERVPVRSCERRGAAIDLVLDRGRENRSQLVMTTVRGGRQVIFWQSARTTKQARPTGAVPRARASGLRDLEIVVDTHERYAWRFSEQQATTSAGALVAGDYGVLRDGSLVATVERKGLDDLVSSLTSGKLRYQLADLAAVPRAAVVVEERYSRVLTLEHVRPAAVLERLAECQVRFPQVPVMFCETRKLAQEWTYRFLAAALVASEEEDHGVATITDLRDAPALEPAPPTPAEVRAWAALHGHVVSDRGRVPRAVVEAYVAAHAPGAPG